MADGRLEKRNVVGLAVQRLRRLIRHPSVVVAAVVAITIVTIAFLGLYVFGWKGGSLAERTLWDWSKLLIVPVALAVVAYLFGRSENRVAQRIAEERNKDAQVQAYFDQMAQLLLDDNLPAQDKYSRLRMLVRARTKDVLWKLDPDRKRNLLQFLHEADLIRRPGENDGEERHPIIGLSGADLQGANLNRLALEDADLSGADMKGADLSGAVLTGADLGGADLSYSRLVEADLRGADLTNANLSYADLTGAKVTREQLTACKPLQGTSERSGSRSSRR